MARLIFNVLGVLMVVLGVLGIALPVLPTTPFLLLALWFFGRGSERLRKWLLCNKIFGNYIRNYHSGRGVPVRVKAWTLALLWVTIGFSAYKVDSIWLKITLLVVAVAVTIHILLLGRRRVMVLVPTEEEARYIDGAVVCGVGMAEVAATLVRVLKKRPRMVVLAGIGGADPASGLSIGDCVVVDSERVSGLPARYNKIYECPWTTITKLQKMTATTVCKVAENGGEGVENMEGAAFFAICLAAGVRFLELRAVSNLTTDRREDWCVDDAARALAVGVKHIFDEIET